MKSLAPQRRPTCEADDAGDAVEGHRRRKPQRLGVTRVDRRTSIFIGERSYAGIGLIDDVNRRSDLLDAVILRVGTARADFGFSTLEQAHLIMAVGAGPVIAEQAPYLLEPNDP